MLERGEYTKTLDRVILRGIVVRSARAFGHHLKQRFFLNEKALNRENLRIWHTYYKPKPAHDNVPNWQAYLERYRQLVVETLEIADETGWRGLETPVKIEWERRGGRAI